MYSGWKREIEYGDLFHELFRAKGKGSGGKGGDHNLNERAEIGATRSLKWLKKIDIYIKLHDGSKKR